MPALFPNLSHGLLTITGEKKHKKEDKDENYHCVVRHCGTFSRTMRVPFEVEADKVDATYNDGVLKITLPNGSTLPARRTSPCHC